MTLLCSPTPTYPTASSNLSTSRSPSCKVRAMPLCALRSVVFAPATCISSTAVYRVPFQALPLVTRWLAWLDACAQHPQMRVSMDGRGRAKDNIRIDRFWKTIKYEYIYILPEENGAALYSGIKRFIDNYNYHRRHQGIDRQVPSKLYIRPAA